MAKTTPVVSASDRLKSLRSKAITKEPAAKKDDRSQIYVSEQDYRDLVELKSVIGVLEPTLKEREKECKNKLFEKFVSTWWKDKALPQNPRIILRKRDEKGNEILIDDSKFMFQVKFREQGLTKVLPNVENLPENTTVEDMLIQILTTSVGISEENAHSILKEEEIRVVQQLQLVESIDAMLESEDALRKSFAEKLLQFFTSEGKNGTVTVPEVTDEERSAVVQTVQLVCLKKGFFERACKYVESEKELSSLIRFVQATLQLGSFEFGVGDMPVDRTKRLQDAAVRFMKSDEK